MEITTSLLRDGFKTRYRHNKDGSVSVVHEGKVIGTFSNNDQAKQYVLSVKDAISDARFEQKLSIQDVPYVTYDKATNSVTSWTEEGLAAEAKRLGIGLNRMKVLAHRDSRKVARMNALASLKSNENLNAAGWDGYIAPVPIVSAAATAPAMMVNNTSKTIKPNTLVSSSLPTRNTTAQTPISVQAPAVRATTQAPAVQPIVRTPVAQAPAVQTYQPATTQRTQAQPTAAQRVVAAKTQFQSAPSRVVNNAGTQTSQVTSSRRRPNSLVADRYAALRKQ